MEGFEEGRLGGESGEREGCVPGVGWREVDGEGEDAVAVAVSSLAAELQGASFEAEGERTGHHISTQPLAHSYSSTSSF